jgi:Dyp-type peroxidase family
MARGVSAEPIFQTDDIQGDILVGLLKRVEKFVFFTVGTGEEDKAAFRTFLSTLQITTMQECLRQRAAVAASKAAGSTALLSTPGLNIAFTRSGLEVLGADEFAADEFNAGMAASRDGLADPDPAGWTILGPNQPVDGVFLVTGATEAEVDNVIALRLAPAAANGWTHVHTEVGTVRPDPVAGHEHFGYADGVSQPAVRGQVAPGVPLDPTTGSDPDQAEPGRDLLWPGEFIFGYPGQDPGAAEFTEQGPPPDPDTDFTRNGAFLVFRRLTQQVPEFDLSVKAAAVAIRADIIPPGGEPSADLVGAQLVGRWKSGAPLINAPHADDPAVAEGTVGALDFEFDGDREGLLCPWAAHIRKAYPRDDVRHNVGPTRTAVDAAEAFTQTHRMMRRGIAFGPELTAAEALAGTTTQQRGLLFACYVTNIFDQFEFVQQFWVNDPTFVQPDSGVDAVIGQSLTDATLPFTFGMPFVNSGDKATRELGRFVHMEGGEYFFAPSLTTIGALAK